MQASERLLAAAVLLAVLSGCGDGAVSSDGPDASVTTAGSMPDAPYGVVADVTYAGDVSRLDSTATVYLFLRERGTRMPLAVQYFPAAELPKRAFFATGQPLEDVELVARLSRSGRVERTADDLEVRTWVEGNGHPPKTMAMRLTDRPGSPKTVASDERLPKHVAPRTTTVRVLVTIDSAAGLSPDAPVFVIARDGENPIPLAVRKLEVRDLPAEVVLTDEDSMLFSHRLSDAGSFELLARVGPAGSHAAAPDVPQSPAVMVDATRLPDHFALAIAGTGRRQLSR